MPDVDEIGATGCADLVGVTPLLLDLPNKFSLKELDGVVKKEDIWPG